MTAWPGRRGVGPLWRSREGQPRPLPGHLGRQSRHRAGRPPQRAFGSAEELLFDIGPALADTRLLSFVVVAGPAGPECRPEPLAASGATPLARTVGQAVALTLWGFEGIGGKELPADFAASWADIAREHHLPPLAVPPLPEAPETR